MTIRGWMLLASAMAAFVAAQVTGIGLLGNVAYLIIALVVVSLVWIHAAARGLGVAHQPSQECVGQGDTLKVAAVLQTRIPLPPPWIEVTHHTTMPDRPVTRLVSLLLERTNGHAWAVMCRRRGEFRLGPTTIVVGDPFGLARAQRDDPTTHHVLVVPVAARWPEDLLNLLAPSLHTQHLRWRDASVPSASVREYRVGDPLRNIHWRSSARHEQLMSRELETPHDADLVIMLDNHRDARVIIDPPAYRADGTEMASSDDVMALAAMTVLVAALAQQRDIRLMHTGAPPVTLASVRQPEHIEHAEQALARYESTGAQPLSLAPPPRALGRNSLLVVITAAQGADWVQPLCRLARSGQSLRVLHVAVHAPPDAAAQDLLEAYRVPLIIVDRTGDAPHLAGDPVAYSSVTPP